MWNHCGCVTVFQAAALCVTVFQAAAPSLCGSSWFFIVADALDTEFEAKFQWTVAAHCVNIRPFYLCLLISWHKGSLFRKWNLMIVVMMVMKKNFKEHNLERKELDLRQWITKNPFVRLNGDWRNNGTLRWIKPRSVTVIHSSDIENMVWVKKHVQLWRVK